MLKKLSFGVALAALSVVAVMAAAKPVALPNDQPGSIPALLASERIRTDLALTRDQRRTMDALRAAYRQSCREIVQAADIASEASRREAANAVSEITAEFNQRARALLNSNQLRRLSEIEVRALGGQYLLSLDARERLGITPPQERKLAAIHSEQIAHANKINARFERCDTGCHERLIALRENRIRAAKEMEQVLTPSQRTAFVNMAGRPLPD